MRQLSFDDCEPAPSPRLCACGCGKPTPLAQVASKRHGYKRGEPTKWLKGHAGKGARAPGSLSPHWTGDDASYSAIHAYLAKHYPKRGVCEECGKRSKRTEHALSHGRAYSRNRDDYRELCPPCHRQYDLAGRTFSPESTAKMSVAQQRRWDREREQGIRRAHPRGAANPNAKLTEAKVVEIRRKYAAGGTSLRLLAKEFGMSKPVILKIIQRRSWAHVPD
jgi:hypothetical protein